MSAIKGKQLSILQCPYCQFTTKLITIFSKHLSLIHEKQQKEVWDEINDGPKLCRCGCGIETIFLNWKHGYNEFISGHNANLYNSYDKETAERIAATRGNNWKGKKSWCNGLTKQTSKRVKERAEKSAVVVRRQFAEGERTAWNKDLTKETDKRLAAYSKKLSKEFSTGQRKVWHDGKTIETDERLKLKIQNLTEKYKTKQLTQWHAGKTVAEDPRIEKIWKSRNPDLEYAHIRWTHEEIERLLQQNTQIRLERIDSYKNDRTNSLWMKCSGCSWFEKVSLLFARNDRCPKCHPQGSILQNEILDWVKSLGTVATGNVSGIIGRQELDIFIPSSNVAIEVNGLYWHSESCGKDERYHQLKSERCRLLNIKLIHVFEDEWRQKQDIVKSIIASRLKISQRNIGARKCVLRQITSQERKEFFESNHLDGDTMATVAYGLFFQDVLVYALSLRKPFHKNDKTMEVARCCPKMLHNIPGGLSRLVSAAKIWCKDKDIVKLMTYVDTRLGGTGVGYIKAGFEETSRTPPRFWWTDFADRFNRFKFKADSKNGLTEAAVAEAAGVVKIWGCENVVYTIKINN